MSCSVSARFSPLETTSSQCTFRLRREFTIIIFTEVSGNMKCDLTWDNIALMFNRNAKIDLYMSMYVLLYIYVRRKY